MHRNARREQIVPSVDHARLPNELADLDDVRTYGFKAKRMVALIYAHFGKELGGVEAGRKT
jgi:hypothetical protein